MGRRGCRARRLSTRKSVAHNCSSFFTASVGSGPASTAASASSRSCRSPTPMTRVATSRLPSAKRSATCAGEPYPAQHGAHGGGAAHLVVDIGAGDQHREPLRARRLRQRTTGKDADVEHAHVLVKAGGDDAGEILRPPILVRARPARARVECVVIDLGAIETAAVDHVEDRVGFAGSGDAGREEQALLLEPVESVGDAARGQHLLSRELRPIADRFAELIVKLEQRDLLRGPAASGFAPGCARSRRDIAHLIALDADLGRHIGLRIERMDMAADGRLRRAVAVERGGVDPVDADVERPVSARTASVSSPLIRMPPVTPAPNAISETLQSGAAEQIFSYHCC